MQAEKYIISIGGGELRQKETLPIDRFIASLAKKRAGERRAVALFFPTASYDSLPYFNTFRKTYTSELGLKAEVALLTKKDIPLEKIKEKIENADMIYVGGGNTLHMLEVWKKTGVDILIKEAYERGVILSGLSAGAICWFEKMYTDSEILYGSSSEYSTHPALGWVEGYISPHYNQRQEDFDKTLDLSGETAFAVEDKAALVFKNGALLGALSSGGRAYLVKRGLEKEIIPEIEETC